MNEQNDALTYDEFVGVARHTVQKIRAYPAYCKKDMSYFLILFPNELKDYLMRREINRLGEINRLQRVGGTA